MWRLLRISVLVLAALSVSGLASAIEGNKSGYLEKTADDHDKKFLKELAEKEKHHQLELEKLEKEHETLTNRVTELEKQISEVKDAGSKLKFRDSLMTFFQLLTINSWLFNIFFPVLIINLVIYLALREKAFWSRFKVWIIILGAFILLLMVSPLLAQGPPAGKSLPENLERLRQVMELKKYPLEQAIYLLQQAEGMREEGLTSVELPKLPAWSGRVKPPAVVDLYSSLEIHYSLLLLYLETRRPVPAVAELRKICDLPPATMSADDQPRWETLLNIALEEKELQGEVPVLAEAYAAFLAKHGQPQDLSWLGETLAEKGHPAAALKVLGEALRLSRKSPELLRLAQVAFPLKPSLTQEALILGLSRATDATEIFPMITFALDRGILTEELRQKALDQLIRVSRQVSDLLAAGEVLLSSRQPTLAPLLVQRALKIAMSPQARLEIARWCVKHQLYPLAYEVIWKLLQEGGGVAEDLRVAPPKFPTGTPPGPYQLVPQDIRLSVFLGLLDQVLGRREPAEKLFSETVNAEVERMLRRAGYQLQGNLNHFFYLKNIWVQLHQEQNLEKLLPLYIYLQEEYLKNLDRQQRQKVRAIQEKITILKQQQEEQEKTLAGLNSEIRRLQFRLFLNSMKYLTVLLVILLILIGCGVKAYYHAETVTTYKTFAFLGKYLECLGWVLCFSLILVAPGVTLLLGGQLAQIFQRQEQHLAALSGGGAVPAPAGAPPDAAAPPAGRRCPRCGKAYPDSWAGSFCDDCGAPLV
jgi:tetratricopeptide (TPR) repeat protein